jgi:hypothetical protein
MSAELTLVALATGGTIALVSAAYLFGFSKKETIGDDQAVTSLVQSYAPGTRLKTIVVADDKHSALVVTQQNKVFLLVLMGDGPIVREILASHLRKTGDSACQIDVGDFGFPKRKFLKDEQALAPIFSALQQGQMQ